MLYPDAYEYPIVLAAMLSKTFDDIGRNAVGSFMFHATVMHTVDSSLPICNRMQHTIRQHVAVAMHLNIAPHSTQLH